MSCTIPRCTPLLALPVMLAGALSFAAPLRAADTGDQDWPCQQRRVPEISAGQVWTGPPLEPFSDSWGDDTAVAELAHEITARRTDIEAAKSLIQRFAAGAGPDKKRELTALAAGMLSILNRERASIIAGIERYSRRQHELADRIENTSSQLGALPADGTPEQQAKRSDLQEMQTWDTRIFQERERSLTYVCELPVTIEQRAFALGRAIQGELAP